MEKLFPAIVCKYIKMDIGTAKVTQEEMQGIHHELIDVQNYNEPYNVKVFQENVVQLSKML